MPKLYSAREVLKLLKKAGFARVSHIGSHIKLRAIREDRTLTVIIPNHKTIARGTLGSILRQAAMTREEFENL